MEKAVFFDLWNTLIFCPTRKKVEEILDLLGLEDDYEELMTDVRKITFTDKSVKFSDFIRKYLVDHGSNIDEKVFDIVERLWRSRLDDAKPFPETIEALNDLKTDYKLVLISNIDVSGSEFFKKTYPEIIECFTEILLSCEIGIVKPDPRIFKMALSAVNIMPENAWMVGDRIQDDVKGALDSGINPILISRGKEAFKHEYPVVRSLTEVRGIIEGETR